MRVLFVSRYIFLGPSGVGKTAYYLLRELKKEKDLKIRVINLRKPPKNAIEASIRLFFVVKKLIKEKYDILYLHHNDDILPTLFLILKYPTIVCIHDLIPLITRERKFLYNLYFKISLLVLKFLIKHRKIVIICPSKTTKEDLLKFGFPKNRIIVLNWGIDHNLYKPIEVFQREKEEKDKIIIGFLGAWIKKEGRKKVDLLIDSFLELKKKYKNLRLILAGRYPNWLIERYKNEIEFLGILSEEKVPEFYNKIDIFVYPSEYEGFGLQILEAMSCKTLVLASDIPVFREILPKELLFKLNKENLIKKIEEFLNKRKIREYSEILYKKSLEYSWEKAAKKLIKILKIITDNGQ